jgi:tRNA-specific 2-thiouridylase
MKNKIRETITGDIPPNRVLVALSGGVDSAIAAHLLKTRGVDISAVYMRTWQNENDLSECPWREDLESARSVAEFLGIPFAIVGMIEKYRRFVVEPLIAGYHSGTTPNPDILCNQFIKFGALVEYARENGFSHLATGHYCRIEEKSGQFFLLEGVDDTKDQSYFLSRVDGRALPQVLFPVGGLLKKEVRTLAQQIGLPNATRKESQDICFLGGKIPLQDFLHSHLSEERGEIVTPDGKVLGCHQGLYRYTLGQRKGIGLPSNCDFEKFVVIGKNLAKNQLIVAFESDPHNGLAVNSICLTDMHFLGSPLVGHHRLLAKVRYRDPAVSVEISFAPNHRATVEFSQTQRALAPGQTCAIYDGNRLIGSGIYAQRSAHGMSRRDSTEKHSTFSANSPDDGAMRKMKGLALVAMGMLALWGTPLPARQTIEAAPIPEMQAVETPASPHELLMDARRLFKDGEFGKSAKVCKHITHKFPQAAEAPVALEICGEAYINQRRFQLAFRALQKLFDKYPNYPDFENAIALEFQLAQRLADGERNYFWGKIPGLRDREFAIRVFQHIVDHAPYSPQAPRALLQIATLGVKTKEPTVAIGALEQLIDEYSNTEDAQRAYLLLAQIYRGMSPGTAYDQRAVENSINCFREFLLLYGDSPLVEEAEQKLAEMKNLLAANKLSVGDFYLRNCNSPNAAAIYYEDVIGAVPDSPAALCAKERLDEIRGIDVK